MKNLPNFQLKLNLWWLYPYLVSFQACPLAPIAAACEGCFSHPCISPGNDGPDPLQPQICPGLLGRGPAPTASGTEGVCVCVCETPLGPALGSGSCWDESARLWLGAEQGWPSPAYLRPQECPGSAGLLGSAPTPGRAASRPCGLGQRPRLGKPGKAAQPQSFVLQETPQSATHKATQNAWSRVCSSCLCHPCWAQQEGQP